jgi:tripeptidyl-peptidase-1
MQFGARGTSIFMSSSDGGVGGSQPTCSSTCTFVTSVGATTGFSPETAANFSSSGFSNFFAASSYQSSVMSSFAANLSSTYAGLYNPKGRAFPDFSVHGTHTFVVKSKVESGGS